MGWVDQGRQRHGWFGDGKAPARDKEAVSGERDPSGPDGLDRRIAAIVHGSVAAMPRAARQRAERLASGENLARLTEILRALASQDPSSPGAADDGPVAALRVAARIAADPRADARAGVESLAAAIQAVGLDRWPGLLRDVHERAKALALQAGEGKPGADVGAGSFQTANAGAVLSLAGWAVAALASALAVYKLSEAKRQKVFQSHGIGNAAARNYRVHHVVAWNASQARPAQRILGLVGIGVHDPINLMPLRTTLHQGLHTRAYYNAVNDDMNRAYGTGGGRPAVEAALVAIKARLFATGTYP